MKKIRVTDTRGAIDYLTPFILMVFGLGWLIGAEASWYWGLFVMIAAGLWQAARNRRDDRPVKFVVSEGEEDET